MEKTGLLYFKKNFGECHSFGTDADLLSGFLSAILDFARLASGETITGMEFGSLKMNIGTHETRVYAILFEQNDDPNAMLTRLGKIISLFESEYVVEIAQFNGNVSVFEPFADRLIELKLAQKNCGGRPECVGCPNSSKLLPLKLFIQKLRQ